MQALAHPSHPRTVPLALQQATGLFFQEPNNNALRVAHRLEQQILEQNHCEGMVFGPEQHLAKQLGVTSQVIRQALRILEWRDFGQVRRGADGGLKLHNPQLSTAARLLAIHFSAQNISVDQVTRERQRLLAILSKINANASEALRSLFELIEKALVANDTDQRTSQPNRALHIAQQLLKNRQQSRTGDKLGCIDALCERFYAGKPIIVQALRILESLGLVDGKRGRNGGFQFATPSAGAIVIAVHPYLNRYFNDPTAVRDIIWSINQVNAHSAAGIDREGNDLFTLQQKLKSTTAEKTHAFLQLEALRTLAELANQPILHTLVRCFWYCTIQNEYFLAPLEQWATNEERPIFIELLESVRLGLADRAQSLVVDLAWVQYPPSAD